MPFPNSWRPQAPLDPVRLGRDADGGYVLPRAVVDAADALVTCGLGLEWTFEEHFRRLSAAPIRCYDHTIGRDTWIAGLVDDVRRRRPDTWRLRRSYRRLFLTSPSATHRRIRIGTEFTGPGHRTLTDLLDTGPDGALGSVLLKIDIEGGEYRLLPEILALEDRIAALIIEFHDVDLHRERITTFLGSLRRLGVCWVHANNSGGLDQDGDPVVLEMTLVGPENRGGGARESRESARLSVPNDPRFPDPPVRFLEG